MEVRWPLWLFLVVYIYNNQKHKSLQVEREKLGDGQKGASQSILVLCMCCPNGLIIVALVVIRITTVDLHL